jgi:hypothetical protein
VITSLTTLNDRLQARIQALEKAAKADLPAAGGVFGEKEKVAEPAKADPKEVKALKDRMAKLESELKNKGKECKWDPRLLRFLVPACTNPLTGIQLAQYVH